MALPNPTLTFVESTKGAPASTTRSVVRDAIAATINLLSGDQGWTAVNATTADDAKNPGLVISAPASSPIAGFRIILGAADTGRVEPAAAEYVTPDTTVTDGQFAVGWGPDGMDGAANWYDANPLGTKWFSELWRAIPAAAVTQTWAVGSEESLLLAWRGAADIDTGFLYTGAICEPWNLDGLCAEADERLYGMVTGGIGSITAAWQTLAAAGGPFIHSTTQNGTGGRMAIRDPNTLALVPTRCNASRTTGTFVTGATSFTTPNGKPVLDWRSIGVFKSDGSIYYGKLREISLFNVEIARREYLDNGALKAILWGPNVGTTSDTFAMRAG